MDRGASGWVVCVDGKGEGALVEGHGMYGSGEQGGAWVGWGMCCGGCVVRASTALVNGMLCTTCREHARREGDCCQVAGVGVHACSQGTGARVLRVCFRGTAGGEGTPSSSSRCSYSCFFFFFYFFILIVSFFLVAVFPGEEGLGRGA